MLLLFTICTFLCKVHAECMVQCGLFVLGPFLWFLINVLIEPAVPSSYSSTESEVAAVCVGKNSHNRYHFIVSSNGLHAWSP